jgi:hypothetical protein
MDPLSAPEGRVVASLVEKQLTTPQYYPLTLSLLVAACNQTSSRDPVTSYAEHEVLGVLESLKVKRLVRAVLPSHGRSVVRFRHVLDEALGLDAPQLAVLSVLELRGPQTVAELRTRTERMTAIETVDHELDLLAGRDEPLVQRIGRRPGQKEDRWVSLLQGGDVALAAEASAPLAQVVTPRARDDDVRGELADLRAEVAALRRAVEELRSALGG